MSKLREYAQREFDRELKECREAYRKAWGRIHPSKECYWYQCALHNMTEDYNTTLGVLYMCYTNDDRRYKHSVRVQLEGFFNYLDTLQWKDLEPYCCEHELMGYFT